MSRKCDLYLAIALLIGILCDWAVASQGFVEPEERLKEIIKNYTKHQRPRNETGHTLPNGHRARYPVIVEVNLFINSFSSVSVVDMDYSLDLLLRQRWRDARLVVPGDFRYLSISYLKDSLWIPDLFFRNAKHGLLHTITTPNYLLWLNPDGTITFSQKLTIKLSCPMNLWNFPMDTQKCRLEIGSYGYSMEDLRFRWWDSSEHVAMSDTLHLNEFAKPAFTTGYCHKSYKTTGEFACIYVEFTLIRKFGFYLIYTYLPSILIITISWLSFLIDYHAVPARISIGLLSILSLMTESAATVQKLPRVSYVKAIDVWLFACLAFVVISLLEFAIVNTLARRESKKRQRTDLRSVVRQELLFIGRTSGVFDARGSGLLDAKENNSAEEEMTLMGGGPGSMGNGRRFASGLRQQPGPVVHSLNAQKLDRVFIFMFPLCFGGFNVGYWLYFCATFEKLSIF